MNTIISILPSPKAVAVGVPALAVTRELPSVPAQETLRLALSSSRVMPVTTVPRHVPMKRVALERSESVATGERRISVAQDEHQDVLDDARGLVQFWERVYADGRVTASELMEARVRTDRLFQDACESQLALEWTDAGERKASAQLMALPVAHVERYERSILRRAATIGFTRLRATIIPFPDTSTPRDAA